MHIEHTDTLRTRFFASIRPDPNSDCILWSRSLANGYGQMRAGDRSSRVVRATHVSWFLKHGTWPEQDMLHRCDNPPCVNPDHLFEGDDMVNHLDAVAKGRVAGARLAYLERAELLALSDTEIRLDEAAALFGVPRHYLIDLRSGRGVRKPRGARRHEVGSRRLTAAEIAAEVGCGVGAIQARIKAGVSGEALLDGKYDSLRLRTK